MGRHLYKERQILIGNPLLKSSYTTLVKDYLVERSFYFVKEIFIDTIDYFVIL